MLYRFYKDVKRRLNNGDVTDEDEVKTEFLGALESFFEGYKDYKTPKEMIEKTALKFANKVVFSGGKASVDGKSFYSKAELANYFYDDLVRCLTDINPLWGAYNKIDLLLNDIASFLAKKYIISNKVVTCFDDVITSTITKYRLNGQKIKNKEDLQRCVNFILSEYFDKNNMVVFTNDKGSRKYVAKRTKEEILQEMYDSARLSGFSELSEGIIRQCYVKSFNYTYILKNDQEEKMKKSI